MSEARRLPAQLRRLLSSARNRSADSRGTRPPGQRRAEATAAARSWPSSDGRPSEIDPSELRRRLTTRNQAVRRLRAELAARDEELAARDEELAARHEELAARDEELARVTRLLVQRDDSATASIRYLGQLFVYPTDSLIGRFLEAGKGWDSVLQPILQTLVTAERPFVCEVGSNIGASLVQILAAKPEAEVLAFEPADRFRPYLLRNLQLMGGAPDVQVHPYLLGERPGSGRLYVNASTASAVQPHYGGLRAESEQPVEVRTLDEFVGTRLDFLKVDTDGSEFEVLRGGETALNEHRPVVHLELATFAASEPLDGLAWLQRLGYRRFLCLTPTGGLVGMTSEPDQAVRWADANTYCDIVTCHEGEPVKVEELAARLST